MPHKLTESSKATILLRKKIHDGEIDLSDNPKEIWSSDPVFMEHKLDNFISKFNRIRSAESKDNSSKFH